MVVLPSIRRKYMNPRIPRGETVSMSECVVTLASDSVSYTGGARTVGVTVMWNGEALSVNADYTLSYANNVNLGPATVTVTGMGQFSGSVTKTFYVVADQPAGDWQFTLADFPEKIEFSKFADSTHYWYSQICPSHDETKLLVAVGSSYNIHVGSWTGFDPKTYERTGMTTGGKNAGNALYTPDGIHFLMQSYSTRGVQMHEATSAYDVTTIGSKTSGLSVSLFENVNGAGISDDGLHVLVGMGNSLVSYDLSTPFDLSTAHNRKEGSIGMTGGAFFVNQNNGKQILRVGSSAISLITLESSWDASSVSDVDFITPPDIEISGTTYSGDGFFRGVAVNRAGNKIVFMGSSLEVTSSPRPDTNMAYAALVDFSA